MAKRIRVVSFIVFALGLCALAWSALAVRPAPAQAFADAFPNAGCSNPDPVVAVTDIRWRRGA